MCTAFCATQLVDRSLRNGPSEELNISQMIEAICIGLLFSISFAFFSFGVFKIQKFVKNHAKGGSIDMHTVSKHLLA